MNEWIEAWDKVAKLGPDALNYFIHAAGLQGLVTCHKPCKECLK